ncbi:MAG: hypothetical protein RIS70_3731 [Planctomycetota bacterium]|jgi:hypothetical protein
MRNFLLGFIAGAATLYGSMSFHLIQAKDGFHLIRKNSLTFTDTYADIREFGVGDWREHSGLAEALTKSDRPSLMDDAVKNSVRNSWNHLWEKDPAE